MEGSLVIEKLQNTFAVTESGARGLIKAAIASFFLYISYMAPMLIIMFFFNSLLSGEMVQTSTYLAIILGAAVIMYLIINRQYYLTYGVTYKESTDLRKDIIATLRELPMSYFSKHDLADLSQTIMKDVADIEQAISHAIPQTMGLTVYLIVLAIMLLMGHFKLGLAVVAPVFLSILFMTLSGNVQSRNAEKYYLKLRTNSDAFQEAIEMQQEIKAYGLINDIEENIKEKLKESERIHLKAELGNGLFVQLAQVLLKFTFPLTILVGAKLFFQGEVNLLYLLGYTMAGNRMTESVAGIYEYLGMMYFFRASFERINELRQTPVQTGQDVALNSFNIQCNNVSFGYGENPVVQDVSFVAKEGEVTAIVGPSGCGKTTMLKLISRLYDYEEGSITIDGKEIRQIHPETLYGNISIVFQEVQLFNMSIKENIRLGRSDATDEEVYEAAKMANIHEFAKRLPEGYDTIIGENGEKLSGGERQRLSIARAFLKDAPIVLLDEISASLDVENEMIIQESLNKLLKGRTVLIISHRLKSIENADQIIVMNNGYVESIGSHEELMGESFIYQSMVKKSRLTEAYTY